MKETELPKDKEYIIKIIAAIPTVFILLYLQNSEYDIQWFGEGSFSNTMSLLIVAALIFISFYLITGFAAIKLGLGQDKEER